MEMLVLYYCIIFRYGAGCPLLHSRDSPKSDEQFPDQKGMLWLKPSRCENVLLLFVPFCFGNVSCLSMKYFGSGLEMFHAFL